MSFFSISETCGRGEEAEVGGDALLARKSGGVVGKAVFSAITMAGCEEEEEGEESVPSQVMDFVRVSAGGSEFANLPGLGWVERYLDLGCART